LGDLSEVPGANGQGETIEETKNNLREAIQLILEERMADIFEDCRGCHSRKGVHWMKRRDLERRLRIAAAI